jgi:hypothetical protein
MEKEAQIKVLYCQNIEHEIQPLLNDGWRIKNMISETMSAGLSPKIIIYLER